MSDTSSFSDTLNQIGEKLSAAIHAGDVNEATILVAQLSNMQLKFDINVKRQESEQRNIDHEFSVRVHVEDRLSDGCYFNLQVKSTDTIQDLKRKVMLKYNFPEEVQRWIIGKKIPEKDVKLSQCGVKGPGHTLYLYLVTARSVGLSKQDYEARRNSLKQGASVLHKQQTQSSGHSPVLKDPPEPFWPAPPSPSETQYNSYSNNSPLLASSPVLGIGEFDQTQNSYGTVRQTSKKSLTSGSSLIQEMLLGSSSANNGTDAESHPIPVTSEGASVAPALWDFVYGRSQGRVSPPQEHFPISSPSSEKIGWPCPMCTYINLPVRPGCEICAAPRPQEYQIPPDYQMTAEECSLLENQQILERMTREAEQEEILANYQQLVDTDNLDLIPNTEAFQCPICFDDIDAGEGITLRECLHMFCRHCLGDAVRMCEDAILKCPYQDGVYSCQSILQEREVRALVPEDVYLRYLQRGLDQAESQTVNSYHCKTADCPGWCVYEDLVNFFTCPVCARENCLTCKAIHEGMNCKQYQDDLKLRSNNDSAARQTAELLQKLVADGEAMHCPKCKVVVQKKGGCDWIKCSICKTEICWVTKGPRWGPLGEGDVSGGCRCRMAGRKCHPNCINCH